MRPALAFMVLVALAACREEIVTIPAPVPLTEEAVSFFCQMNVLEHGGPKAQVHLEGQPAPLFFAQVRDGLAYLKSPEREARVVASYVSDMGAVADWNAPGAGNWIDAQTAYFVIDSGVSGGMGAPEVVPFADKNDALAFVRTHGGRVTDLTQIPDASVLGPVTVTTDLEMLQ